MRLLTDLHLIDILRCHLGQQHKIVCVGQNQHHGLARRNDSSDGVNGALVYIAADGRLDRRSGQPRFGGKLTFLELRNFGLHIAQFAERLGAFLVVDLEDLKLDFTDFGSGAGCGSNQFASLTVKSCCLSLEGKDPAFLNKLLFKYPFG